MIYVNVSLSVFFILLTLVQKTKFFWTIFLKSFDDFFYLFRVPLKKLCLTCRFHDALIDVLRRRYRDHWFPEKPFKGSGFRLGHLYTLGGGGGSRYNSYKKLSFDLCDNFKLQLRILMYRMAHLVYYHWGCTTIYCP